MEGRLLTKKKLDLRPGMTIVHIKCTFNSRTFYLNSRRTHLHQAVHLFKGYGGGAALLHATKLISLHQAFLLHHLVFSEEGRVISSWRLGERGQEVAIRPTWRAQTTFENVK